MWEGAVLHMTQEGLQRKRVGRDGGSGDVWTGGKVRAMTWRLGFLKTTRLMRGEQVFGATGSQVRNDDFDLGSFSGDGGKYLESREFEEGKTAQQLN